MFTLFTSENRDIFMIGDFNYDIFLNSIYQLKSMDFSKIFERLMYNKLIQFLDQFNVPYQNQFGFSQ